MSYSDVRDATALVGTKAAGEKYIQESTTVVVKSSSGGPVTVTDGDLLVYDILTTGGLKWNAAKRSSATTDRPVGVAIESVTIPQTTANGDKHVAVKVMLRGFHPAVRVTANGAAGQFLVPSATAGQGTPVAAGSITAVQAGLIYATQTEAAGSNLGACIVHIP